MRKDKDDPWTRGVVAAVSNNPESRGDLFLVRAVDYGDDFVVTNNHIRRYPDTVRTAYTDIPALAIPCRLATLEKRMDVKSMEERKEQMSLLLRRQER